MSSRSDVDQDLQGMALSIAGLVWINAYSISPNELLSRLICGLSCGSTRFLRVIVANSQGSSENLRMLFEDGIRHDRTEHRSVP
jgi:hypothetical protein